MTKGFKLPAKKAQVLSRNLYDIYNIQVIEFVLMTKI
jgi:hypothetical protein